MTYDDDHRFGDNPTTPEQIRGMRQTQNPRNEPVGHFTGRCKHCGSRDLWDDNSAYGCRTCGRIFFT